LRLPDLRLLGELLKPANLDSGLLHPVSTLRDLDLGVHVRDLRVEVQGSGVFKSGQSSGVINPVPGTGVLDPEQGSGVSNPGSAFGDLDTGSQDRNCSNFFRRSLRKVLRIEFDFPKSKN